MRTLSFIFLLCISIQSLAWEKPGIVNTISENQRVDCRSRRDTSKHLNHDIRTELVFYTEGKNDSEIVDISKITVGNCGHVSILHFTSRKTGFVGFSGGCYEYYDKLYRTSNGGKTWTLVRYTNYEYEYRHQYLHMFSQRRGIIMATYRSGCIYYLTTKNGGRHWTKHKQVIPGDSSSYRISQFEFQPGGIIKLSLTTQSEAPANAKFPDLYSDDSGKTFTLRR